MCSKQKINPAKYTAELAEHLNAHFAARPGGLVTKAAGVGPYLNLFLNRAEVFKLVVATVLEQKEKFGRTSKWAGKKVVIEHTSNNPNSPLHIGNPPGPAAAAPAEEEEGSPGRRRRRSSSLGAAKSGSQPDGPQTGLGPWPGAPLAAAAMPPPGR